MTNERNERECFMFGFGTQANQSTKHSVDSSFCHRSLVCLAEGKALVDCCALRWQKGHRCVDWLCV